MTIIEATEFFKRLLKETTGKRELKVFKNFIEILSSLKSLDLSNDDLLLIQNEIEALNLKAYHENKRKHFSKKLNLFEKYLKEKFSLVPKGYYTAIGMSLGMCFGVAIGPVFGASGTSFGLAIGMLIGLAIGRTKDMEAEKQNRALSAK